MNVVVFSGAGISAAAGIPTYRGPDGIWTRNPSLEHRMHARSLRNNFDSVVKEMEDMRAGVLGKQPTRAHKIIADWERDHHVTVITQNVDGLHSAAGSSRVLELHGSLLRTKTDTDGRSRPDVVLFGETLDKRVVKAADKAVRAADVVLAIGTSATVYPAADLLEMAANIVDLRLGYKLVWMNTHVPENSRLHSAVQVLGDVQVTIRQALSAS